MSAAEERQPEIVDDENVDIGLESNENVDSDEQLGK